MRNIAKGKRVFVGLSGGVDSSVAALILKERGYDVLGVYLKCFNIDGCAVRDAEDARLVAEKLEIPFYVFDLEEEYKRRVVNYMVRAYERGVTPNPDVMCNREIKFGLFLEKALSRGAEYVATGHYVRLRRGKLCTARDAKKDQSYFLWTLTKKELAHCLFPIGNYVKPRVRKLAERAGLPTAHKKDSQGICFLGDVKIRDFLKAYLPVKTGNVVTPDGAVIGTHEGAHFYTIGQRRGLHVATGERLFVAAKNLETNTLVAVPAGDELLYGKDVTLTEVNFITGTPALPRRVLARIRYQQPLQKATLCKLRTNDYKLVFDKPQKFVTPGQSAVCYSRQGFGTHEMLGGGVIG